MSKHTPGPWVVERRSTMVATALNGADGYELFDVRCDVPEFEANARLTAAAPDLLEALIAAEKKLCIAEYHLDKGENDSVVFGSEILLARAAIAKARGEQA